MPGQQAKDFCFTLNNYTTDDIYKLRELENSDAVCYIICGLESGESGTPHVQGFVQLERKKTLAGVKSLLGSNRYHVEIRRGTPEQASEYCKKDGDYFEFGSIRTTGQGHRSDLARVKTMLDEGASISDIADNCFEAFLKYGKGIQLYRDIRTGHRQWPTQVIWLWGKTGSGKSRLAFEESMRMCNGSVSYIGDASLKWFDPYRGEKGVVLDDFDGSAPLPLLLRVFDRYPLRVPIKGGFVEFQARYIWVTSNRSPEELYGSDFQYDALMRRLTPPLGQIIEMN